MELNQTTSVFLKIEGTITVEAEQNIKGQEAALLRPKIELEMSNDIEHLAIACAMVFKRSPEFRYLLFKTLSNHYDHMDIEKDRLTEGN